MTKLKRRFLFYNRKYFGGQLDPDTKVTWSRKLRGAYADCEDSEPLEIRIHIEWKPYWDVWNWNLLHEMAHLATPQEKTHHGPRWLRLMRSLVRRGAFDKIF